MSSLRNLVIASLLFSVSATAAELPHFGIGTPATPAQVAGWAIGVRPDGQGLPPGKGSVADGDEIYATQCAACHGTFGEANGRYPRIAGNGKLTGERPEETVGSFWPYATTLYDYINRAMPFPAPRSLSADQVYAVTAYVLNLNNLVDDSFVADKDSLPKLKMPNRDGFIWKDPRPDTHDVACMTNCRPAEEIKIFSSAEGKTLTPRTTGKLDTDMPQ